MKAIQNKKGMTLIEILVVLMLSTIVMIIVGNILLSSMGFFKTTTDTNFDKQGVDGVADAIRRELTYASNIIVDQEDNPPSGQWHKISLNEEHQLLFDDILTFTSGYYGQRTLKIEARNDTDLARIDLTFAFYDIEAIKQYETKSSLYLVNKGKNMMQDNASEEPIYLDISKDSGYVIYYQKGTYVVRDDEDNPTPDPTPSGTGTVADELNCKDETISKPGEDGNNKGIWTSGANYRRGDYVIHDDIWYILVVDSNNTGITPNLTWEWKTLNATYTTDSQYEYGDIVLYQDKYYQVHSENGSINFPPNVTSVWAGPYDSAHDCITATVITPSYTVCPVVTQKKCTGTIADEYYKLRTVNNKGTWYANMPNIKKGDFVKYSGSKDNGVHYWYRALSDSLIGYTPEIGDQNRDSGWKRIVEVDKAGKGTPAVYSDTSAYVKGDVIYYPNNSTYYEATPQKAGNVNIIWMYDPVKNPQYWTKISAPSGKQCLY